MEEKILEVVNVLRGISVPVGLMNQIAAPIRSCADRLEVLAGEMREETAKAEEAAAVLNAVPKEEA